MNKQELDRILSSHEFKTEGFRKEDLISEAQNTRKALINAITPLFHRQLKILIVCLLIGVGITVISLFCIVLSVRVLLLSGSAIKIVLYSLIIALCLLILFWGVLFFYYSTRYFPLFHSFSIEKKYRINNHKYLCKFSNKEIYSIVKDLSHKLGIHNPHKVGFLINYKYSYNSWINVLLNRRKILYLPMSLELLNISELKAAIVERLLFFSKECDGIFRTVALYDRFWRFLRHYEYKISGIYENDDEDDFEDENCFNIPNKLFLQLLKNPFKGFSNLSKYVYATWCPSNKLPFGSDTKYVLEYIAANLESCAKHLAPFFIPKYVGTDAYKSYICKDEWMLAKISDYLYRGFIWINGEQEGYNNIKSVCNDVEGALKLFIKRASELDGISLDPSIPLLTQFVSNRNYAIHFCKFRWISTNHGWMWPTHLVPARIIDILKNNPTYTTNWDNRPSVSLCTLAFKEYKRTIAESHKPLPNGPFSNKTKIITLNEYKAFLYSKKPQKSIPITQLMYNIQKSFYDYYLEDYKELETCYLRNHRDYATKAAAMNAFLNRYNNEHLEYLYIFNNEVLEVSEGGLKILKKYFSLLKKEISLNPSIEAFEKVYDNYLRSKKEWEQGINEILKDFGE